MPPRLSEHFPGLDQSGIGGEFFGPRAPSFLRLGPPPPPLPFGFNLCGPIYFSCHKIGHIHLAVFFLRGGGVALNCQQGKSYAKLNECHNVTYYAPVAAERFEKLRPFGAPFQLFFSLTPIIIRYSNFLLNRLITFEAVIKG